MKKILRIFLMLIPLIFGSSIYIIFRSESLVMFRWFRFLNIDNLIQSIRILNASDYPNWFRYNLPDGLWISSYVLIILEIWKKEMMVNKLFWILLIPFIAVFSEIFQSIGIVIGTFDVFDLLFYISGTAIPLLFNSKTNLIIIKNYDKN